MDKLDQQLQHSIHGEFDLGWKLVQELEKERPNCNRCAFNRAWYVLRNGDLRKGMELIARGRFEQVFGSAPLKTNKPIFNIRDRNHINNIKDKFVLLNLEGGLGDEMIGFRYANEIAKLGGKAIVAAHPFMMDFFSSQKNVSGLVASQAAESTFFDYWIPAMSAETCFDNTYETLPNKPYLEAKPEYINKFKKIIKQNNKLKIGIRYVGNPEFEHVQFRLFDENLMFNLFKDLTDKVDVYSLQKDLGVNKHLPNYITDLENHLATWDDTAGAISNLDLIISSCTSVPHLSAAMGKRTWIIVPILGYYVWAHQSNEDEFGGEYTHYYESARVFRQTKFGDWTEAFENVRK
jgi:hypothetical protein